MGNRWAKCWYWTQQWPLSTETFHLLRGTHSTCLEIQQCLLALGSIPTHLVYIPECIISQVLDAQGAPRFRSGRCAEDTTYWGWVNTGTLRMEKHIHAKSMNMAGSNIMLCLGTSIQTAQLQYGSYTRRLHAVGHDLVFVHKSWCLLPAVALPIRKHWR